MKAQPKGRPTGRQNSELKGVVKRMTGRLTSDPQLEEQGRKEMLGPAESRGRGAWRRLDPDPHRRG